MANTPITSASKTFSSATPLQNEKNIRAVKANLFEETVIKKLLYHLDISFSAFLTIS